MLKGLSRDTRPDEQPEGTYPFGKNGVQNFTRGVVQNEPGFLPSSAIIPYTPIGVIETPKKPVIFSTDGTFSAIGYYDRVSDSYQPILNDAAESYKLNFFLDKYITGESQLNDLDQVIVAFTDKTTNGPRIINCDDPSITDADDLRLFLRASAPDIVASVTTGGILTSGAYFVAVGYVLQDASETNYLAFSQPLIVARNTTGDSTTDKALQITVSNIDTSYDFVKIAIISKIEGVTTAQVLDPIPANDSITINYTGANLTTVLSLDEVLVPTETYDTVGTMGQLNDALYIGDLSKKQRVNWQPYASMIKIRWNSVLDTSSDFQEKIRLGQVRSYMHREVYAFYARLLFLDGTRSEAYIIPGPKDIPSDTAISPLAADQGFSEPTFKIEDTVRNIDYVAKTGDCGVWINDTELYPNTDEYNALTIGGEDLRNQPVRHHKMPSLAWIKENFYSANNQVGREFLPVLGLDVSNITIPAELADEVDGVEILFARRDLGNNTILGQSHITLSATQHGTSETTRLVSTGGNWESNASVSIDAIYGRHLVPRQKNLRFYSFDMLFNKPSVGGDYFIANELSLVQTNTDLPGKGVINGSNKTDDGEDEDIMALVYLIDYTSPEASAPTFVPNENKIRKVSQAQYVPSNSDTGTYKNIELEACLGLSITNDLNLSTDWQIVRLRDENWRMVNQEQTFLTNMVAIRKDLYSSFLSQQLISTGTVLRNGGTTTPLYGGDISVSDYCVNQYGWWIYDNFTGDVIPSYQAGTRVARRYMCEAVSNINLRFEILGNRYSQWYPHNPLSANTSASPADASKLQGSGYLIEHDRRQDPNQFGYSKDLNTIGDLQPATIFNPFKQVVSDFPYRIHRGGKFKREGKQKRSWRTFLPLDYFEAQKNMGRIINLCGLDDRLLIHHENALFLTQDKSVLDSQEISVTLGAGDIFQFEPQEAMSSKLGFAGTKHDLACVLTPHGYIFPDTVRGQVFVFKENLKLLNLSLNEFFLAWMRLKENNPFTGNGIAIGYDPEFERILMTIKNITVNDFSDVVSNYEETPEFFSSLVPNVSIVFKDGRYQKFLGINPTIFDCPSDTPPTIGDYVFTIPETTPINSLIGTVTGTGDAPLNYYIVSGNTSGAFSLDAGTGQIRVAGALDFNTTPVYNIVIKIVDSVAAQDSGTVTINITQVQQPPETSDVYITIPEGLPNSTIIGTVPGSDPNGDTLTWAITAGNDDGAFGINSSTGQVFIADTSLVDFETAAARYLTVSVTDTMFTVFSTVSITILDTPEPPINQVHNITILDTLAEDELVFTIPDFVDPEGAAITYELAYESNTTDFVVDLPERTVKVKAGATLDPTINPISFVIIKGTDPTGLFGVMQINITTDFDPATLVWEGFDYTCELDMTPLPPTSSVDFLVFDIILDNPNFSTDAVDTLAYALTPGIIETGLQVDRNNLRQVVATSDSNASYFASERSVQVGSSNTLYRYIVDYGRIAVLNPGITEFTFKIHLKVTSGDAFAGANRIFFTRQAGGTKIMQTAGSGAQVPVTSGSTTLNSTLIQPAFPSGAAGPLDTSNVPEFIEITYNYSTFAMSYSLL